MSREYVVAAAGTTVANQAVTFAWINPGTTASLEVLRAWLSQSANATSAQQRVQTNTQVTAFPTMVGVTPAKLKLSDPSSAVASGTGGAGTAGVNASAEGTGAKTVIMQDAFNVLNGWLWVPTPPETHIVNASATAGFGVHMPVAPTSLGNWAGGLVFREW